MKLSKHEEECRRCQELKHRLEDVCKELVRVTNRMNRLEGVIRDDLGSEVVKWDARCR